MELLHVHYFLLFYTMMFVTTLSTGYKTFKETDVCSAQRHRIFLGKRHESSAIVSVTDLNENNRHCNFTIEASKHSNGIYVVIQKLSLRRSEATGICLDYLLIRTPKGVVRRTCGEYQVGKTPLESFVIPENTLFVQIEYYAEKPLAPGESIEVSLVFTSYFNDCSKAGANAKPCIPERNEGCIYGRFWEDNIVNCPSQDCLDEDGCEHLSELDDIDYIQPAPITLGAVTTILLLLLLFTTCLWACRKHHVCCWGPFCHPDVSSSRQRASDPDDINDVNTAVLPSAPTIEVIVHPPVFEMAEDASPQVPSHVDPDKDPPPSYESLFPN
ncbi:uncharacterized protein LOC113377967 [Ctenocephalides felis]|uniref:uncharacterized protein LOC113377967 n=1 Tax=Ctenocephalides felis TaxID=7515 RepID=UPI000E6E24A3|nr:uncharacterized protein LOC113377967 [Ctenocephalides felis]